MAKGRGVCNNIRCFSRVMVSPRARIGWGPTLTLHITKPAQSYWAHNYDIDTGVGLIESAWRRGHLVWCAWVPSCEEVLHGSHASFTSGGVVLAVPEVRAVTPVQAWYEFVLARLAERTVVVDADELVEADVPRRLEVPRARRASVRGPALAAGVRRPAAGGLARAVLRGAGPGERVPDAVRVLVAVRAPGERDPLAAGRVAQPLPDRLAAWHAAPAAVHGHEWHELPAVRVVGRPRRLHRDPQPQDAGDVVRPRAVLHDLVVQVHHDAREVGGVEIRELVVGITLCAVHVESH
mmetsp:Transcript_11065/g.31339  ORF Transcript_11065/g.31339 Transcript_11065/m.31339 type:complete len:294 (-) Transcript_11065:66-947(-)